MGQTYDLKNHPSGGELWQKWESGSDIDFVDDEAQETYQRRATRIRKAIELKEPDRIPVRLGAGFLAGHLADVTFEEMMYDAEKAKKAMRQYKAEFKPDLNPVTPQPSGEMLDTLGVEFYDWPGDGLKENVGYQALEDEYLPPEEYDEFIADVEGWMLKKYMPRVFSNLEGLQHLPQFLSTIELPFLGPTFSAFANPDLQEALQTLMEAGEQGAAWGQEVGSIAAEANAEGFPSGLGGFGKAPFDIIGDTIRGTRPTMVDMRKRPEKLKEATEALVPHAIKQAVGGPLASGTPMNIFVLHKGDDSFMSKEDFKEFYWPTLKKVVDAVIDRGIVPWMFAEGRYNERLEIVANDHPDGPIVWYFDKTDMRRAKEILGDKAAIAGNVPTDIIKTGDPEDVEAYCKDLIEDVGPEGFILTPGVTVYRAPPENLHAIIDSVKE
ncbi:MAG: uroporphyrinogen decarboxylase family protein [Halodesulfurarchaeum sp.]|nr:uroporphyrinogen decarboxylase family protein [Halodesulfurarchaeum sp.]